MSDEKTTPEGNESNEGKAINPKDALHELVNASLPQGLHATMQHVDNAMQQSQQAIQQSLQQSATLIANARQHLQQAGLTPSTESETSEAKPSSVSDEVNDPEASTQQGVHAATEAETHVTTALEQQNQLLGHQMKVAMQQVQQSVHQANSQMQQANTAREEALTHLMQGQQQVVQAAPENTVDGSQSPESGEPNASQSDSENSPPSPQPE